MGWWRADIRLALDGNERVLAYLGVLPTLAHCAVLALTIAFGIAINDTVYFVNRFFEARNQGATASSAVNSALRLAGHVMVLIIVLLTLGLAVTMISVFS